MSTVPSTGASSRRNSWLAREDCVRLGVALAATSSNTSQVWMKSLVSFRQQNGGESSNTTSAICVACVIAHLAAITA